MEWEDIKNSVYKLDSDSTNPRPTTRALKELVKYLDEHFVRVADMFTIVTNRLDDLEKE